MNKDMSRYFFRKYEKAGFRVKFGSWPDFQSKTEVDEWIKNQGKPIADKKEEV